ncbi:MAG: TadE/TadG family type IV pilus assembly protein [Anaerolineales bacterium]
MKLNKLAPRKNAAQSIVEFALVLPLLLLLLYGLLETGRLLFIYSTIVTASRQASRYGSATGQGTVNNVPRYQDCDGIKAAAQRADFLNAFDDEDITITYDSGPGTALLDFSPCDSPTDDDVIPSTANNTRIVVEIKGDYLPIVPKIVPFLSRSSNDSPPDPIEGISARTILMSVSIAVTAPPGPWSGTGGGQLSIQIIPSPTTYSEVDQVINITYRVTNTGDEDVEGPFSINTDRGTAVCPGDAELASGAALVCTGTYVITQGDIDARSVNITANAVGSSDTSDPKTVTITADIAPALQLAKTASPTEAGVEGAVITYTFTLTNTGNVVLRAPYEIIDDKLGGYTCPSNDNLAVGASMTCVRTHALTKKEIGGTLVNVATATARFGSQTVTSNESSATVYTSALFLSVVAEPLTVNRAGQIIAYTYYLKNNTNVVLSAPFTISDARVTNESCAGAASPLAPGQRTTCTGSYVVTQTDLNNGVPIVTSNITASAKSGKDTELSNKASVQVIVVQLPLLSLEVSATPNVATELSTPITYTYTLTNSGNVTLTFPFAVKDTPLGLDYVACDSTALAPGGTKVCTGIHQLNPLDLELGSIVNNAVASAMRGTQVITSNPQSVVVVTYAGPRLGLYITPNPTTFVADGESISYTYTLANTGGVPLSGFSVTDYKFALPVDCSGAAASLPIGTSTSCIATFAIPVGAGDYVANTAMATASLPEPITSNTAIAMVSRMGAAPLACGGSVTPSVLALPGNNTMTVSVTNNLLSTDGTPLPLRVDKVIVQWNNDSGHALVGSNRSLRLQSASLDDRTYWIWTGGGGAVGAPGPTEELTPIKTIYIPAGGTSTFTFVFHQDYIYWDNDEYVRIDLSMPCQGGQVYVER